MANANLNWNESLQHAALSDVGMRRSNNQDAYAVDIAGNEDVWRKQGHLLIVADGMGAHAAGELASKLAAESIPHLYRKYRDQSAPEALQKSVIETNAEINRKGEANVDFHNMGTTCSVLALLPQGAMAAHIGDSRVYRLRGETLEQLTFDHSLVWEMQAAGQLTEGSELAKAVPKNVITRSLGPNANVKVDIEGPFPLEVGDTFLLCSDGLSGQISDEEMAPLLAYLHPKEAVQVLVDLANLRGGPDNITVIVAKVIGAGMSTSAAAAQPLTIGAEKPQRNVHPALWALTGASFLAGVGMVFLEPLLALIPAVVGLVALGFILYRMYGISPKGFIVPQGKRFGKGPYTQTRCQASADFVEKLAGIIGQLREAAQDKEWEIDWDSLDSQLQTAEEATQAARPVDALRSYARAVSFMMGEVRAQRQRKQASDSSVNL